MLGTKIKKTKPSKEKVKWYGEVKILQYLKCGAWEVIHLERPSGRKHVDLYLNTNIVERFDGSSEGDTPWQDAMEYVEQRKNELITLTS